MIYLLSRYGMKPVAKELSIVFACPTYTGFCASYTL